MRLRWGLAWAPTLRAGDSHKDAAGWASWTSAGSYYLAAAVADGVSSQDRAREAALGAVAGFVKSLRHDKGPLAAMAAARVAVDVTGSATTLTGARLMWRPGWADVAVAVVHTGDSRAWRLRDGDAELRTLDENLLGAYWSADPANKGKPPPIDGRGGNVLLSCLGHRHAQAEHYDLFSLRRGDALVLCTDGCNQAGLPRQVSGADPREATARLIAAARAEGSVDDATALWIDVV